MNNNGLPTNIHARVWSHRMWTAFLLAVVFFHCLAFGSNQDKNYKSPDRQILFIEDNVGGYQALSPADSANMEVVILDSRQDGLRQIAAALEGRRHISGLHLISHGAPATLALGSLNLGSAELAERGVDLATIRNALLPQADLLLYGCDVAAGEAGQRFIGQLAKATGAHVAASINPTGARELGGDWMLESSTGAMRHAALAFPAYRAVLPTVAGTVAIPFGHPDGSFFTTKMLDGQ
ncbi:MAG: DUF4347 domain-containing protein, partial [Undibacterium sp.]|nr:DUF4347 domain-containing protein [Undibacterium sp.]